MRRSVLFWLTGIALMATTPLISFANALPWNGGSHFLGGWRALPSLKITKIYQVRPGDTLWTLSKSLGVSIQDLVSSNDITNPRFLQVGQQLIYHPALTSIQFGALGDTIHVEARSAPRAAVSPSSIRISNASLSGRSGSLPMDVRILYCTLTAYTAGYESTGKSPGQPGYDVTSTGQRARQGITVAVDPRVIPYGTKLFIPGVGYRVAQDTGGAIVGNHIDVFVNSLTVALNFGVKTNVPVYILPSWYPVRY